MTLDDLLEKLSKRYNRDMTADRSAIILQDFKDWIEREGITDYKALYFCIIYNYKPKMKNTFPEPTEVNDLWKDNKPAKLAFNLADDCLIATKGYDVKSLVKLVWDYRKADEKTPSMCQFIAQWEILAHINGVLRDKGWNETQRVNYLKKRKEEILNDEEISFREDFVEEKENSISALSQSEREEKIKQIGELFT